MDILTKSGYFQIIHFKEIYSQNDLKLAEIYPFRLNFWPEMVHFEQNMVFYAILIQLKNEFNLKIRFNSTS